MDVDRKISEILPKGMIERGEITLDTLLGPIRDLLNRRQLPEDGFSDLQIDLLFRLLSSMDTDKDPKAARVGEREARVASPYIGQLATGFNHGIGRSGHIAAPQPKAPGASLMQQIANKVALDAIRKLGLPAVKDGMVLPISTGMTIALTLSAMRRKFGVNRILYPRIDHDSPTRAINLAGLEHIPIPTILEEDAVRVDMTNLGKIMAKEETFAVLATTTFFPPRESDPIKEIAQLCKEYNAPLIVNNAYGVQSEEVMKSIRSAIDAGRIDAVVQSSDKNFLTPVGGSVVVSPEEQTVEWIAESYAGRASAAPIVQTLGALLATGYKSYLELRKEQRSNRAFLETRLTEIAVDVGQRVLSVVNPVACAITLDGLDAKEIGGRLYNLRITGPRAVAKGNPGSCIDNYPHSYLVMNAAIGASRDDVEEATTKLYKELRM
ncbi:MAG: O-phosphoseryl-tRNA(Sec) selenium transferase [Candidatus Hodarchaeota archaeon]